MSICQWILLYFRSQLSTKNIIHRFILSAYNYYIHRKKEMIDLLFSLNEQKTLISQRFFINDTNPLQWRLLF